MWSIHVVQRNIPWNQVFQFWQYSVYILCVVHIPSSLVFRLSVPLLAVVPDSTGKMTWIEMVNTPGFKKYISPIQHIKDISVLFSRAIVWNTLLTYLTYISTWPLLGPRPWCPDWLSIVPYINKPSQYIWHKCIMGKHIYIWHISFAFPLALFVKQKQFYFMPYS